MPLYRSSLVPAPPSGNYEYTSSPHSTSTSVTHGNGVLRLVPWMLWAPRSIVRMGADIATVGEAGSKLRLGVYADNGNCYPGALILDAGQINGDSATVQDLAAAFSASGLLWIGGAVQSAPTTQPTVRTTNTWTPPVPLVVGTALPSANGTTVGYQQTGVTGALPSTFTSTVAGIGSAVRVLVKGA
jgi:hypothetical protein